MPRCTTIRSWQADGNAEPVSGGEAIPRPNSSDILGVKTHNNLQLTGMMKMLIGHNNPPNVRDFAKANDLSAEDVLSAALEMFLEDFNAWASTSADKRERLVSNIERMPSELDETNIDKAAALLDALLVVVDEGSEKAKPVLEKLKLCLSATAETCGQATDPLNKAVETVRQRISAHLGAVLENQNTKLVCDAKPATSLTYKTAQRTLTIIKGDKPEVEDAAKLPAKYLAPDLKAINAAHKKGEAIPGVKTTPTLTLRVTAIGV